MPLPLITGPLENQLIYRCGHSSLHLDEQYGETVELDMSLVLYPTSALLTAGEARLRVSNEGDERCGLSRRQPSPSQPLAHCLTGHGERTGRVKVQNTRGLR